MRNEGTMLGFGTSLHANLAKFTMISIIPGETFSFPSLHVIKGMFVYLYILIIFRNNIVFSIVSNNKTLTAVWKI